MTGNGFDFSVITSANLTSFYNRIHLKFSLKNLLSWHFSVRLFCVYKAFLETRGIRHHVCLFQLSSSIAGRISLQVIRAPYRQQPAPGQRGRHDDKAARGAGGSASCSGPRGGRARPTATAARPRSPTKAFAPLLYMQAKEPTPLPARSWAATPRRRPAATAATGYPWLATAHAPAGEGRRRWLFLPPGVDPGEGSRPARGLTARFRLCRARPSAKRGRGGCCGSLPEPDVSVPAGLVAWRSRTWAGRWKGLAAGPSGSLAEEECRQSLVYLPQKHALVWRKCPSEGPSLSCSAPGAPRRLSRGTVREPPKFSRSSCGAAEVLRCAVLRLRETASLLHCSSGSESGKLLHCFWFPPLSLSLPPFL